MKNLKIYIFVLVLFLLVVTYLLPLFVKTATVFPSDHVRIDNLRFCGISHLGPNTQRLSICGLLVADKESIPLRIYLYKMPGKVLVAENRVSDRFATGEFIRQFDLPNDSNNGRYKVVVYFYKEIASETEFVLDKK